MSKAQARQSGVYGILCHETGKWYIGESCNLAGRIAGHMAQLRRGYHSQIGPDSLPEKGYTFSAYILELVERERGETFNDHYARRLGREAFWMDKKASYHDGYNRMAPTIRARSALNNDPPIVWSPEDLERFAYVARALEEQKRLKATRRPPGRPREDEEE